MSRYQCPHCHSTINAPAELAGREVSCPGCGNRHQVPSAMDAPAAETARAKQRGTPPAVPSPADRGAAVSPPEPALAPWGDGDRVAKMCARLAELERTWKAGELISAHRGPGWLRLLTHLAPADGEEADAPGSGHQDLRRSAAVSLRDELQRFQHDESHAAPLLHDAAEPRMRRNRLGAHLGELLARPLGPPLLGMLVRADVYGTSGFRFLGVPAGGETASLKRVIEETFAYWNTSPREASQAFIRTGYDGYLVLQAVSRYVNGLRTPAQRFVAELFWPHLPESLFCRAKQERLLCSPAMIHHLTHAIHLTKDLERALLLHALAVTYHNAALRYELAFAAGRVSQCHGYWDVANACWREVLVSTAFWEYLAGRHELLCGPQQGAARLSEVRSRLPAILAGFHTLFARAYARSGDDVSCHRHLATLVRSDFPGTIRNSALLAGVKAAYG